MEKIANIFGYTGSGLMIAFSWTMQIELAIAGLLVLTFQAIHLKAWNLVALNLISVLGLFYQIFS